MNTIKSFIIDSKQSGIILKGSSFTYTDQNNSKQLITISANSIDELPREKSAHLYALHREIHALRRDLANDFMNPVIRAAYTKSNRESSISGYKRNALSSVVSDTDLLLIYAINRSINISSSRLRAIGVDVNSTLHEERSRQYRQFIRLAKVNENIIRLFDRAEQHAINYSYGKMTKASFQRKIIDSSFTPTPGGSLTKAIRKVRREEYQHLDHSISRAIYLEHGINHCHWRLSGNHKDYGGKEVCEVFANATGNRASKTSLNKRGLYHVDEFPSVPHPNCMCQMVPAKET